MEYKFPLIYSITHEHAMTILLQKCVSSFKQEPPKGQTNLFKLISFSFMSAVVCLCGHCKHLIENGEGANERRKGQAQGYKQ